MLNFLPSSDHLLSELGYRLDSLHGSCYGRDYGSFRFLLRARLPPSLIRHVIMAGIFLLIFPSFLFCKR